ncbi:MAG: ankyrin repeat domain-containing protein [Desulfobacterales bacterium]|jgi:ankyrin repeat protein
MPVRFSAIAMCFCLAVGLILGAVAGSGADDLVFFVDAVRENRIDEVRSFLQQGVDVDAQDMFEGNTGLHWAARQGLVEMARLLIDYGANPNARSDDNKTPLHMAAMEGQKELLVILIAHRANVNALDRAGWTPLRWAEAQKHEDIARILMAAGGRR